MHDTASRGHHIDAVRIFGHRFDSRRQIHAEAASGVATTSDIEYSFSSFAESAIREWATPYSKRR
jgi:hypothetical protein